MGYKVNDEVLIKARIKDMNYVDMMYICELITKPDVCIRFKSPTECIVADKTYSDGLKDAWDLAKKIVMGVEDGGFDSQEVIDVFGKSRYYSFKDFTAEEALAKIEAYEKEKSEIKVGDEVRTTCGDTYWIIGITDSYVFGYLSDTKRNMFPVQKLEGLRLTKTGRTTDCIDLLGR